MSYDIDLLDPVTKKVIEFDFKHDIKGGTYEIGGTNEAHLNVTYNYCSILWSVLGDNGIRSLYGKTGAETTPILKKAINSLENDVDENYWKPTQGNVKRALCGLLAFAELRPDGIWNGD